MNARLPVDLGSSMSSLMGKATQALEIASTVTSALREAHAPVSRLAEHADSFQQTSSAVADGLAGGADTVDLASSQALGLGEAPNPGEVGQGLFPFDAGSLLAPLSLWRAAKSTQHGVETLTKGDKVSGGLEVGAGVATGVAATAQAASAWNSLQGFGTLGDALGSTLGGVDGWLLAEAGVDSMLGVVGGVASGVAGLATGAHAVYQGSKQGDTTQTGLGVGRMLASGALVTAAVVGAPEVVVGAALTGVALDLAARFHDHQAKQAA